MEQYALVIGIAKYDNFTNLPKAATDAEAIAQLLEQQSYDVTRLPGKLLQETNRWVIAPEKRVTGKELGQALKMFVLEKAHKQKALIYFAGHGFEVSSWTGEPEGYLATSDCDKEGRNAIRFYDLNTSISNSDFSSLLMLLDCCYAGSLLERKLFHSTITTFHQKQNYCLMTACRAFERAREGAEGGIFTQAVLKGLQVENADERGKISSSKLFDLVSRELANSGQEPIQAGIGRAITLISYAPQTRATLVNETCPYQGLKPFDRDTAQFFFGREPLVELLVEKLTQANFIPVLGASGSGKSSVVRAGLIPKLEKNGWQVLEPIWPGSDPLGKLKATFEEFFRQQGHLRKVRQIASLIDHNPEELYPFIEQLPCSKPILLVVDQFEEVFTICSSEADRRRFIELLTQIGKMTTSPLSVVITMRADFLEPCLNYPFLAQLIETQVVLIQPLVGEHLRQAVAEPARQQGYDFEEGLLEVICRDVGEEKGCLPLLQFALTELWQRRDRTKHQLTVTHYHQLGGLDDGEGNGVSWALNHHAEKLYQDFTEQEQKWVKRICLKLVRTGTDIRDTRQRKPKQELLEMAGDNTADQSVLEDVLDDLVNWRLLVIDNREAWVDLAHEALMDGWKRFAQWRQEDRELRQLADKVADAQREWIKHQQSQQFLMMGGLLSQVRDSWQELEPYLPLSTKFFYQRSEANEKEQAATLIRALTESTLREQSEKVLEILPTRPIEGLILAIQTLDLNLNRLPERILFSVQNSLRKAVEIVQAPSGVLRATGSVFSASSIAANSNNSEESSDSEDSKVSLWNLQNALMGKPFRGHESSVSSVAFSPDGQVIVSGGWDNTIRLWDLQGNPIGKPFRGHESSVSSVAFSPDGQMIVSGGWDNTVRLWDLQGNPISKPLQGHESSVSSIAFSPDSQMIVSGGDDEMVRLWDLQGNPIGKPFQGHESSVSSVAFSPDGQVIVSGGWDNTIRLWDLQGNPIRKPLQGHESSVSSVAFNPDSQMIVSGGGDEMVRLWDLQGNPIGKPFQGHEGIVSSVAFSPDGQMIVSGGWDSAVYLWDLQGNAIGKPFRGHLKAVTSIAFSPDGQMIATGSDDEMVRWWRVGWRAWLQVACNILRNHAIYKNPDTVSARTACEICQKYVFAEEYRDKEKYL